MKIAATLAIALLSTSSFAYAADKGGDKGGRQGTDTSSTSRPGSLKGNGLNIDGSSDDAAKCRSGKAGAALCRERKKAMDMQN